MSSNSKFKPMDTIPPHLKNVLVKLEEPVLGSRLHVMGLNKIRTVAGHFHFDMPKAIGWMELPDDEEDNYE